MSCARDGYWWCESVSVVLEDVVAASRPYFESRAMAVTAADSGPLVCPGGGLPPGWTSTGRVTLLAPSVGPPPSYEWDEWYLFPVPHAPERFAAVEVFVNYSNFGLSEPEALLGPSHREDDPVARRRAVECVTAMQGRFWEQLTRLGPETFIAFGDRLVVVTKDRSLFDKATALCRASSAGTAT
jgi:hypothetical protein